MARAIALLFLGLLSAVGAQAAPPCGGYTVEYIQQPCGFPMDFALLQVSGVNDAGVACGHYLNCGATTIEEGYTWTPETGVVTIPRPPGVLEIWPRDISNAGHVVGKHVDIGFFDPGEYAFLYHRGELVNLYTLPGGTNSEAYGVNSAAVTVGWWGNIVMGIPTGSDAFIWKDSVMHDLGPCFGDSPGSIAYDVNETNAVTGLVYQPVGSPYSSLAFIWQEAKALILPPIPEGKSSEGRAISDDGWVFGHGFIEDRATGQIGRHCFVWDGMQMTDIGVLPGSQFCFAVSMSDSHEGLGYCYTGLGGNAQPFLWSEGRMYGLNDLVSQPGLQLNYPRSINNRGGIVIEAQLDSSGAAVFLRPIDSFADFNCDGTVNGLDLQALLSGWGACPDDSCPADLDGNGIVNGIDLALLLGEWG